MTDVAFLFVYKMYIYTLHSSFSGLGDLDSTWAHNYMWFTCSKQWPSKMNSIAPNNTLIHW